MSILAVLHEGEWRAAEIVGYGLGGSLAYARLNEPYVSFTTTGSMFSPKLELASGSTAIVRWINLDTGRALAVGTNPTISFGPAATRHIGFRVESHGTAAFEDVLTLNLGFYHGDDAGTYNIGDTYDYPAQHVTSVTNLQLLPNLKRFLAASSPLTGHLDCSGLSQLEFIECFNASVQSIDLTGCVSLIRLCLESNNLTQLNLDPVRQSLRDLRAAVQNEGTPGGPWSLTFASLSGPMEQLYHYCIRDQTVLNIIPLTQLPVIEQYWIWNTGQTIANAPIVSPLLNSFAAYGNAYNQASVDLILTSLASLITDGSWRVIDISSGAVPSATGQAAVTTLRANGWTVVVAT